MDISCRTVGALLTRWYDGRLTDVEADAYEQHILLCRPCQSQNDKLRDAMAALASAADAGYPVELVGRLTRHAEILRQRRR